MFFSNIELHFEFKFNKNSLLRIHYSEFLPAGLEQREIHFFMSFPVIETFPHEGHFEKKERIF